jgi:hypothetical protein
MKEPGITGSSAMNKQQSGAQPPAIEQRRQDRLMRQNAEGWVHGAKIWHFSRVTSEVSPLLPFPVRGAWFILADAMPNQTIGLILSLHDEGWAVHADETAAQEGHTERVVQQWFERLRATVTACSGIPRWASEDEA